MIKKICVLILLSAFLSCHTDNDDPAAAIQKEWLGQQVDFGSLQEVVNTYHMYDSTEEKVGSMIFDVYFEKGQLVARDTSQFDDGSVYETAELHLDTSDFVMKQVQINMSTARAGIDVNLRREGEKITGAYVLKRDTVEQTFEIDSTYEYTIFREELYMLLHTLNMDKKDTIHVEALVPTAMSVAEAQLYYAGEETITTPLGTFECNVVWIKSDGTMPSNKVWIQKEPPGRLVKFYVPGPELDIELVSTRPSPGKGQ